MGMLQTRGSLDISPRWQGSEFLWDFQCSGTHASNQGSKIAHAKYIKYFIFSGSQQCDIFNVTNSIMSSRIES